jgi:hypothetical protein
MGRWICVWWCVFNFLFKSYPFNQHLNFLILYTINNKNDQRLGFFSFFGSFWGKTWQVSMQGNRFWNEIVEGDGLPSLEILMS